MMKISFKISILLFLLSGCSLSHYLTVSESKNELPKEYNQFLESLGVNTQQSFQIKSIYCDSLSKSLIYCLNLYKFNKGTNASPLQIRMYNKAGNLVMGWEQCYGDLNFFKLFDSVPLKRISHLPNNYSLKIQNDLNLFNIDSLVKDKVINYIVFHEYTIILFYTKWLGWYSKDAIKRTVSYADKNKEIALIFINTANR